MPHLLPLLIFSDVNLHAPPQTHTIVHRHFLKIVLKSDCMWIVMHGNTPRMEELQIQLRSARAIWPQVWDTTSSHQPICQQVGCINPVFPAWGLENLINWRNTVTTLEIHFVSVYLTQSNPNVNKENRMHQKLDWETCQKKSTITE